jgi:hypothetical protein
MLHQTKLLERVRTNCNADTGLRCFRDFLYRKLGKCCEYAEDCTMRPHADWSRIRECSAHSRPQERRLVVAAAAAIHCYLT